MRCSLKWLSEYVNIIMGPKELAHRLSMVGLESVVEPRYSDKIEGVVTGRIVGLDKHPNADRLTVCQVETGSGVVEVVCGAPNVRIGLVSPLALPGARLKDGFKLKKSKIRGVESFGMLCAEDELGLSADHSGIMDLGDMEPGLALSEFVDFEDYILEVDVTPNRGDTASVIGIARETAALLKQELRLPDVDYTESGQPAAELAGVEIRAPELCPRYCATLLSGLETKPSPWWMKDKLLSAGVRSISNLVDVTNLVMLEYNQPLHAFDFDEVEEHRIVVREAEEGERFTTLDGQERLLTRGMTLICDGKKPVGLAGLMGGLNSEIKNRTSRVLLEAAYFDPTANRRMATNLGMSTEATYRFQRGTDPVGLTEALKRATSLMHRLGGGVVHAGIIDEYPKKVEFQTLPLRVGRCNDYIGIDLSAEEMAGLLNSIRIEAEVVDGDTLQAQVPPWRSDLEREVDLTEEIARLYGYDDIPVTLPPMTGSAKPQPPLNVLEARIRPLMISAGLTQIITYSFIPDRAPAMLGLPESDPRFSQITLINPQSEDQNVMRTSLLHGLLSTLEANLRQGTEAVRLFEYGKVFFSLGEGRLAQEDTMVGGVVCGSGEPAGWTSSGRRVDFYDIKGAVEDLVEGLGLKETGFSRIDPPEYKPGTGALLTVAGREVGRLGQIDDKVCRAFDIGQPVFSFELSADTLQELIEETKPAYTKLDRYPSITRDMALVVDRTVEAGRLLSLAHEYGEDLIKGTAIFDFYRGKPLADNEKSIGLRIRYQSPDRTLTEDEITPIHDGLTEYLINKTGGRLRK